MSKVFNAPALSIEELEARQELSVLAPGDLATEVDKKDDRCGNPPPEPTVLSPI